MNNNKKQDNYKWHDLTKNPNDLPKDNHKVLVAICNPALNLKYYEVLTFAFDLYEYDEFDFDEYKNKKECGFVRLDSDWDCYKVSNVVAWKYIEPFNISGNSQ